MKKSAYAVLALLALVAPLDRRSSPARPVRASDVRLPLLFEANQGQLDPSIRFRTRVGGLNVLFTETEAILQPRNRRAGSAVRIRLAGGNPRAAVSGERRHPGRSHYFIGSDPARWRTGVPMFGKVRYAEAYPGIDLVYYGNDERRLEFDFAVAPGADPRAIGLQLEGAERVSIGPQGDLKIETSGEAISFGKPIVYQERAGARSEIAGAYVARGARSIAFEIGDYDRSLPLVIDPPLLGFSTYLGGVGGNEEARGVALDGQGNVYVTGLVASENFPTLGDPNTHVRGVDAFVVKFDPTASTLLYSTFVGGSASDFGYGIAVDSAGAAYVGGQTYSDDFPTRNPFQSRHAGQTEAFLFKLDAAGAMVFSTFLGGNGDDSCNGIALDSNGNAYLTGSTRSANFPTTAGAFDRSCGFDGNCDPQFGFPSPDAFVSKFDAAGALVYSTYLGGGKDENLGTARGRIAVDAAGNAYVAGTTYSIDFPVKAAYSSTRKGTTDAFVAKLNAAGSDLVWSTYLGGQEYEFGGPIALGPGGDVFVAGATNSADFPTVNAFQSSFTGNQYYNAFVARISADGARLVYSSYLGGTPEYVNGDMAHAIAVDGAGNAYLTGEGNSADFPSKFPFQRPAGSWDVFVAKVPPSGSPIVYSTLIGGDNYDLGYGIAADSKGSAYVVGSTASVDYPTAWPYQKKPGGDWDYEAFVTKVVDATLALSSVHFDLGDVAVGRKSKTQTLTLSNTGAQDVRIDAIRKPGGTQAPSPSDCGAFTLAHSTVPFTIPAGGKQDVEIVFAPSADKSYDCLVEITSDSPVRSLAHARLVGIGSGLVSITMKYTTVYQGSNAQFSLKFTNPTSAPLSFDFYLVLVSPTGSPLLIGQMTVPLTSDQVIKIDTLQLPIPTTAPLGTYTLLAAAAQGGQIIAADTATFTVYRYLFTPAP